MKPRLIGFAAITFVIALAALLITLYPSGRTIAPTSIDTLGGKTVNLFQAGNDRITLVSFWASTCKPCIKEMPDFIKLHKDYTDKKLNLIGITMPYDPPDLTYAAVQHFNIPWPVALDIEGKWTTIFGDINVAPTTLLIDPAGQVIWERKGLVDFEQLRQKIDKLLAKRIRKPLE